MCEINKQTKIYCDDVKNINMKRTKQGYGVRL